LEAPTGFGKSPVAVASALTLGSSYICTSTKNLQTQYTRDFPFIRTAKGKNNFTCEVKEDFIRNRTYKCKPCGSTSSKYECPHTTVEYGPCMSDKNFGCKYKPLLKDYQVINKGSKEEQVILFNEEKYRDKYFDWSHVENLKEDAIRDWRPCHYFHQMNIALAASHSVLNYAIFLGLLNKNLPARELLVLDESHLLETEIVRFRGISISRKKWRKYIPELKIDNHEYDVSGWLEFITDLEEEMRDIRIPPQNKEIMIEASQDLEKLELTIDAISANSNNWIVSDVKWEGREVTRVELKPLDVSPYCKDVFSKCEKTLMMSATILDPDAFCSSIGLVPKDVKIIRVDSDFPVGNRPIQTLGVAYLNYANLQKDEVKLAISNAIDKIMTYHRDYKGIIHTTSYEQLNFIRENVSEGNRRRLLITDPELERDEVIAKHAGSKKPTVLISPSLHIGLDLKDDLSRFQIITKVPYLSLADRWIDEKRKRNEQWYTWQTALKLVQGYGRSIRSKEDWAITYVLDAAFGHFVFRNRDILPDWFRAAIRRTSS
jgi:ATP-dependent DNA helicase DinG